MAENGTLPLSLTDLVVLCLVAEEPRHGFAVARELRPDSQIGQVWTVHRPLVYRAMDHLLADGLIDAARTEPGDQGPRRTVYRATRKGRDRCRRWLERPVSHPRDARAELLVKFMFLARSGRPLAHLARVQLEQFRAATAGLERTAVVASSGAERLVALWRLESLRATNRVLRQVIEDEQTV